MKKLLILLLVVLVLFAAVIPVAADPGGQPNDPHAGSPSSGENAGWNETPPGPGAPWTPDS